MYKTINEYEFRQAFKDADRDNYSYDGYTALYEFLDEVCSSDEKGFELDVIGICCDFTEYEDLKEFQGVYYDDVAGDKFKTIEEIEEETIVIRIEDSDSFIIQDF